MLLLSTVVLIGGTEMTTEMNPSCKLRETQCLSPVRAQNHGLLERVANVKKCQAGRTLLILLQP